MGGEWASGEELNGIGDDGGNDDDDDDDDADDTAAVAADGGGDGGNADNDNDDVNDMSELECRTDADWCVQCVKGNVLGKD